MTSPNPRLLRITTVPISLKLLLRGQLSFFKEAGFEVLAVSAPGEEIAALHAEGIRHQVVPMTRKITPWQDLLCLVALVRIMRAFKPDIVHTHTPKAGLLGMMAAWWCRVPVRMHTVAGLPLMEAQGLKRKVLVLTERITYWCATHVLPNSTGLMAFIEHGIYPGRLPAGKFAIVGKGSSNGIDTTFFKRTEALDQQALQIREKYGIRANDVVFCFVGRVVRDKGIGELVAAFQKLEPVGDARLFLLLVGHFEQELDPLEPADVEFLHRNPQVILAGFQNDVRPWLCAADIFTFPSYREGFPNVVMQASCLEVACVVSDINGCNEIIQQEVTGLIVKPKDAEGLRRAMQLLIADQALRVRFSKRSRQYIEDNFGQHSVWSALRETYNQAIKQVR
jgi:glycosyltransferase involved in cell wall biosynthesis